jgi:hypothetical protein
MAVVVDVMRVRRKRNRRGGDSSRCSTDGSGFFEQNTWPWVTRIDHSYYIDENATNPNPFLNDVAKQ